MKKLLFALLLVGMSAHANPPGDVGSALTPAKGIDLGAVYGNAEQSQEEAQSEAKEAKARADAKAEDEQRRKAALDIVTSALQNAGIDPTGMTYTFHAGPCGSDFGPVVCSPDDYYATNGNIVCDVEIPKDLFGDLNAAKVKTSCLPVTQ